MAAAATVAPLSSRETAPHSTFLFYFYKKVAPFLPGRASLLWRVSDAEKRLEHSSLVCFIFLSFFPQEHPGKKQKPNVNTAKQRNSRDEVLFPAREAFAL
jgi:hypothetical protein